MSECERWVCDCSGWCGAKAEPPSPRPNGKSSGTMFLDTVLRDVILQEMIHKRIGELLSEKDHEEEAIVYHRACIVGREWEIVDRVAMVESCDIDLAVLRAEIAGFEEVDNQ